MIKKGDEQLPEAVAQMVEHGEEHPQSLEARNPGLCMKILVARAKGATQKSVQEEFGVGRSLIERLDGQYQEVLRREREKAAILELQKAHLGTKLALRSMELLAEDDEAIKKEGPYKLSIAAKVNWESSDRLMDSLGMGAEKTEGVSLQKAQALLDEIKGK